MQERLIQGETLRALGELAGGAAHHLNNLLTSVVGRIQLLRRGAVDERAARALEIVERAAKDGAEVVRRLQQFAGMRRAMPPRAVAETRVDGAAVVLAVGDTGVGMSERCGAVPTSPSSRRRA